MELEQRVQILEQELEILKSQIQATLLDIQEQLLTNAYPSLRADDATNDGGYSGGGDMPAPSAPRNDPHNEIKQESFSNVRRVTFDDSGTAYETAAPPQQAQALPVAPRPAAPQPAPRQAAMETGWSTLSELEAWASEKVKEIGTKRTRKLIEMHYRKGRFDDDAKEMLLGLISLYEEEPRQNSEKRAPVVQTRPASPQPAPKQVRQKQPAPHPQPATQAKPAPRPTVDSRPTQPARRKEADSAEEDSPHNLVLKLIAGVQNAGAGVTRRKRHG